MKTVLIAVFAAWCSLGFGVAPVAAQTMNPEFGDPVFQPFSVFSPDAPLDALGPRVLVCFHGFLSALPNGAMKRVRKMAQADYTVVGVNYDYFDVAGAEAGLRAFIAEHLQGREVAVFGTSLGGYWATWFAAEAEAEKLVLINPLVAPEAYLQRYIGQEVESERRSTRFTVTAEGVAAYGAATRRPLADKTMTLVVLTREDEMLIENYAAFAAFPRATVELYEGSHTINLKNHPAKDAIAAFFKAVE